MKIQTTAGGSNRNSVFDYGKGLSYELFVCKELGWEHGREDQRYGDTAHGVEIKFDMKLNEFGNLFFERSQRPMRKDGTRRGDFIKAGVFKKSRWYLIGDCSRALRFFSPQLREWLDQNHDQLDFKQRDTFTGYPIPYDQIREIAEREHLWDLPWNYCLKD